MKTLICLGLLAALGAFTVHAQRGGRQDGHGHRGPGGDGHRNQTANNTEGRHPFGEGLNSLFGSQPGSTRPPGSRGRPHGNFSGIRPGFLLTDGVLFSSWNRTVGGLEVTQMGISQDTENKVVILNFDERLAAAGLERGAVLYDSSTAVHTTVVKARHSCYLIPPTAVDVSAVVISRNGTLVTDPLTEVRLNATGRELTDEERQVLEEGSLNLQMFCANLSFYDTAPVTDGAFPASAASLPAGQRVISILTVDNKVSILADAPPQAGPLGGRAFFRPRFHSTRGHGGDRRGHDSHRGPRSTTLPTVTVLPP